MLYFGIRSSNPGKYLSVQDELTKLLSDRFEVVSVSNKSHSISKAMDMLIAFVRHITSCSFIIIDTYSTTNFYFAFFLSIFSKPFKKPIAFYLHGGDLGSRLKQNPKMCSLMFSNAHALIAPSGFMKSEFEKFGYEPKLIPNFIKINNYPYRQRSLNEIRLFWLRNFKHHYNPMLAVKVILNLLQNGFNATLTMVGPDGKDGSFDEVKDFVLRNKLAEYVSFTGSLTKPEWIEKSHASNILINTTFIDNTPISVLECMALGILVVSTNVGGIPFLLEHKVDSLLVKPDNVDEMVEAILEFHQNKDFAKQVSSVARQKVEEFDWNVVKNKWTELIESASQLK